MIKSFHIKLDKYIDKLAWHRGGVFSYFLGILLTLTGLFIRLAIAPVEAGLPFITFFPAATLAAILGGWGSAIFTIIVTSFLAAWLFIPPFNTLNWGVINSEVFAVISVFCIGELLVVLVVEIMYRQRGHYLDTTHLLKQLNDAQQELELAAIAFHTQGSTVVTDSNTSILHINRAFSLMYGYSLEEVIGQQPSMFKSGLHDEKFYQEIWDSLKQNRFWEGEVWDKRKNGELFCAWLQVSAIVSKDGSISHYVGNSSDITEYRRAQDELKTYHAYLQELVAERTQALHDSNARSQAILDTVADGIITINMQNIIQTVNPAAESIFGYAAVELIGQNIQLLIPKQYQNEHDDCFNDSEKSSKVGILFNQREIKGLCKDGSTRLLDLSVSAMQLDNGRFLIAVLRDISARKTAENQLNRFFSLSLDMICICHADGYFKRVNPAFTETLGWSTEEFLTRPFLDFIHPDDHLATLKEIEKQIQHGEKVLNFENRFRHKNGSWRIFLWASTPNNDGYMYATARDITEQKQVEEEARRLYLKLSQFKNTLDKTLDCIFIWHSETLRFTYVNAGAIEKVGYSEDELLEMTVLRVESELNIEKLQQLTLPLMSGSQPSLTFQTKYRHKDGHLIPVEVFLQYVKLNQQDSCFLSIVHDITERKLFEQALIDAKTEAEHANAAKSDFLATMSHEIRTPMNGVIGMVDVLQQSSLQGYQIEMVDTIRDSAFSLLNIIEDILDFSKIEAGKLEIDNTPISITEVVEKACLMLDNLAAKKNVRLSIFIDPTIPAIVLGDTQRLRQIIVNLVNNAIKFSSEQNNLGRVIVKTVLIESTPTKAVVEICINDNGIGMDAETKARLFQPFVQADSTTTRRFGGTGLGLSIARKLTQLMGGDITVQSEPNQGATFTARLSFTPVTSEITDSALTSLVKGVFCLVIGNDAEMAHHLVIYLSQAGALVIQMPDLSAAQQFLATQELCHKDWVWLIDSHNTLCTAEDLQFIVNNSKAKVILIQQGQRQQPRWLNSGRILELDGNILTRQAIFQAIAISIGKLDITVDSSNDSKTEIDFIAPSRSSALQQGELILVAEDNETNQKVILQQLALLGFTADMANNGQEALKRWRTGDYALLLTDLNMPKMDGYELATAIRTEENNCRHIPIIALTANALKSEAQHCRDIGIDDYLSKPATLVEMKAMLQKWLQHSHEKQKRPIEKLIPEISEVTELKKPMNLDVLIKQVGNNNNIINKLLETFQSTATIIAKELQVAFEAEQPTQIADLAHKLKSSARSVGALELGELCEAMEHAGKMKQMNVLAKILPHFSEEIHNVINYLNTLQLLKK